jgi:hypothetical protein
MGYYSPMSNRDPITTILADAVPAVAAHLGIERIDAVVRDARSMSGGIGSELVQRVEGLISAYDDALATGRDPSGMGDAFSKWFKDHFHVSVVATPKGGKNLKEQAKLFLWAAAYGPGVYRSTETLKKDWDALKPKIPELVAMFTQEGGVDRVREIRTPLATYQNLKGFSTHTFRAYVQALDATFNELKGWRRKVLGGGLTVALAGPDKFNGTASGKYNISGDTLFVRATPDIMRRSGIGYASPEYILIHELGHRYERFHQTPDVPFTTPYSRKEGMGAGEAFAEMFALGHFGIKSYRALEFGNLVDRFEEQMAAR